MEGKEGVKLGDPGVHPLPRPTSPTDEPPPHDDEPKTPPPPDGGLRAWLQVVAAHCVLINTWASNGRPSCSSYYHAELSYTDSGTNTPFSPPQGYINSFGIFQPYYVAALSRPPSDIAWIGSLANFLIYFVGALSGRATDAGFFRPTILAGLALQLAGAFATANATAYWQVLLAQGLCQGLGAGLLFCPVIALVSSYFARRRTLAISLQASGAATGGMIFPAIAQSLLDRRAATAPHDRLAHVGNLGAFPDSGQHELLELVLGLRAGGRQRAVPAHPDRAGLDQSGQGCVRDLLRTAVEVSPLVHGQTHAVVIAELVVAQHEPDHRDHAAQHHERNGVDLEEFRPVEPPGPAVVVHDSVPSCYRSPAP